MSDNALFFIHVGLPKTASTFLQKKVFPHLTGLTYVDKHDVFKTIEALATSRSGRYLFSHECILRDNTRGRIANDFYLRKLKQYIPDARPILFLRRHDRWTKSRYTYYLHKAGKKTFDEYVSLDRDGSTITRDELLYRKDIELLEHYFTVPPLVIFHEELLESPHETIRLLANYLGGGITPKIMQVLDHQVNASFGEKQLLYMRAFSRKFLRPLKPGGILPRKVRGKLRTSQMYLVGLVARLLPLGGIKKELPLIPKIALAAIRNEMRDDWTWCREYAARTRSLLFTEID